MLPHNDNHDEPEEQAVQKPYCKPEIIHELDLETRAGSPNSWDPLALPGE